MIQCKITKKNILTCVTSIISVVDSRERAATRAGEQALLAATISVKEDETLLGTTGQKAPLSLDVQVLDDGPHADQKTYKHTVSSCY